MKKTSVIQRATSLSRCLTADENADLDALLRLARAAVRWNKVESPDGHYMSTGSDDHCVELARAIERVTRKS